MRIPGVTMQTMRDQIVARIEQLWQRKSLVGKGSLRYCEPGRNRGFLEMTRTRCSDDSACRALPENAARCESVGLAAHTITTSNSRRWLRPSFGRVQNASFLRHSFGRCIRERVQIRARDAGR